jgi:hypothetical protein
MQLTKSEVFEVENVLNSLMEVKLDPEVAFKVASNLILAMDFVAKIRKSYQAVDGYKEVEKLRNELFVELGATAKPDGSFTIPADKAKAAGERMDAFNTLNKDVIDEQNAYQVKFDEMLSKIVELDFKIINRKELTAEIEPGKLVTMIKVGMLTDGNK